MSEIAVWWGLFLIILFFAIEERNRDEDLYCEMRQIYEASSGEYGWPEFKEDADCDE